MSAKTTIITISSPICTFLLCKNLNLFVDVAKREGIKEKDAEDAIKMVASGGSGERRGEERERKKEER